MRYVYLIRDLTNDKVYVGQTMNFSRRKAGHLYASRKGLDRPLYRSMRARGTENFTFEVLEECDDEVINDRETHWVSHFDSFNPEKGYNLTSGGSRNTDVSDETRQKLSEAHKGKEKSSSHRANMRIPHNWPSSLLGKNHPHFGKIVSEETRRKLSVSASGRIGDRNSNVKFTQEIILLVKQRLSEGVRICDISREFSISRSQINRIRDGKQWKHLDHH